MYARILRAATLSVIFCAIATLAARGDEAAEKGRAVLERYKDAVITLSIVSSISYGGEQQENESESNGVIIDPDGLTVLSLTAVDPTSLLPGGGDGEPQIVSKVKSIKMLLADGSELVGEVVLRDREQDLAFIRPNEKPATPMAYVDIQQAASPQVLDEVLVLGQLGKVTRRAHSVFIERIEAIVDRPRTFYVPGEHRARSIMCSPVFTLDGGFVGMGVMRTIASHQQGRMGMGDNMMVIIISAADIQEAAKQAPPAGAQVPEETPTPDSTPAPEPDSQAAAPAEDASGV